MYNYIIDPITKKTVNIVSNRGKNILKGYIYFLQKGGIYDDQFVKDCNYKWNNDPYFIAHKNLRKPYTESDKCSFFSHCNKVTNCGEGCDNNNCYWVPNPDKNSCLDGICLKSRPKT